MITMHRARARSGLPKSLMLVIAALAVTWIGTARAAELKKIAEIAIPGEKLTAFDIGFVDQQAQRYYLADRSNKAVDIFDARTNTYIGRAPGFVGAIPRADGSCCNNAKSGPNGVLVVGNLLIPFTRAICVEIEPARRRIAVELPEGLKDLNRP